ncbi:MAG: DUF4476 domain-containing protein [Bacteroidetes bacterium]|nr:DUF4476 domain-containing protein [Bacteroidota bacterium]
MKTRLLTLVFLTASFISNAQTSNAIFFAENGERFNLVLNGILQNEKAETNVKLTGLNAPSYKTRILFADKALGMVDYTLNFVEMGAEVTYTIKKNSKGAYVVRYVSEVPLTQAPPSTPNQTVIVYSTAPAAVGTTTTTHQTTTTTSGNPDNVNINMGVNVDGSGGGVNMNISGMDGNMESSSTTTTTTTHSTTTTYQDPPPPVKTTVVYVDGYNGKIGCPVPMSRGDFESFKGSLSSKSFEDSKMTMAKQVLNNNCLTSAQVREVMGLFTFEQNKLDFAKYAYGRTYDIGNFYKVNDAFTFESSIDELNNYINTQR